MLTFSRCFPSSAAKVIMYQTQVKTYIHTVLLVLLRTLSTLQDTFIYYHTLVECFYSLHLALPLELQAPKTPHPSRWNQTSNPRVSFVITLKSSALPRELLKAMDEHSMINCAAVLKVSDNLKRQGEGGAT